MRAEPGRTEALLLFKIVRKSFIKAALAKESDELIVEISSNIFLSVVWRAGWLYEMKFLCLLPHDVSSFVQHFTQIFGF